MSDTIYYVPMKNPLVALRSELVKKTFFMIKSEEIMNDSSHNGHNKLQKSNSIVSMDKDPA